jgi:hypothetical protein
MYRAKKSTSDRFSSDESNSSSKSSQRAAGNAGKRSKLLQGRIGDLLYIQLPNAQSSSLPYEPNLKMSDLMERVCMKENLDSLDFFMMLMVDDNNKHGLLDYTIPKEKALLDMFQYSSIKLCPKLIYEVTLTNPADYEHGAFGEGSVTTYG